MAFGHPLVSHEITPEKDVFVKFRTNVDDASIAEAEQAFTNLYDLGVKKVNLLISSDGGSVKRGLEFHNFLLSLPIELTTHNVGVVDSIANVVYMAGKHRYATPNSRFMMHGV